MRAVAASKTAMNEACFMSRFPSLPCKSAGICLVSPRKRYLVGCRRRRRQRLAKGQPHRRNLLLLGDDDFLTETPEQLVTSITQLGLGHVDGALMMRHHHRHEIAIDFAGPPDLHVGHHLSTR